MNTLKWNGKEYKVTRGLLSKKLFEEWIDNEGKAVLRNRLKNMNAKWFFGTARTKRVLFREARQALKRSGTFAGALKKQLDEFPDLARKIGIQIKRSGHKHLFSADATRALVAIPRAIVHNEFKIFLFQSLAGHASLRCFTGLSARVLREVGLEAEERFFQYMKKGKQYLHPNCKAIFLDVEPAYNWRLNQVAGHYYCAYAGKNGEDLGNRGQLKRFKTEMGEFMKGQRIHLSRLSKDQVDEIARAFRSS